MYKNIFMSIFNPVPAGTRLKPATRLLRWLWQVFSFLQIVDFSLVLNFEDPFRNSCLDFQNTFEK